MPVTIRFTFKELLPHFNWACFYYAWNTREAQAADLKKDALDLINQLEDKHGVSAIYDFWNAEVNDEDDVMLENGVTLHFLRQQRPSPGQAYCHSLSDYVDKRLGAFATSVNAGCAISSGNDPYETMLRQTICDRFAEAAAEKLQKDIIKFNGIRPAVGYPSLPDQSFIFILDRLLNLNSIGITLTESGAMYPHASVCGLLIDNPNARYFGVGEIDDTQFCDYARRKQMQVETLKKFLKLNI